MQPNDQNIPPTLRRSNYERFRTLILDALSRYPSPVPLPPLDNLSSLTTVARCRDALKSLRLFKWDDVDQDRLNSLGVFYGLKGPAIGPDPKKEPPPNVPEILVAPPRVASLHDEHELKALLLLFEREILTQPIVFKASFDLSENELEALRILYPNTMIANHAVHGQYVIL